MTHVRDLANVEVEGFIVRPDKCTSAVGVRKDDSLAVVAALLARAGRARENSVGIYGYAWMWTYTRTHAHTHTRTSAYTHTRAHSRTQTHTHKHARMYAHSQTDRPTVIPIVTVVIHQPGSDWADAVVGAEVAPRASVGTSRVVLEAVIGVCLSSHARAGRQTIGQRRTLLLSLVPSHAHVSKQRIWHFFQSCTNYLIGVGSSFKCSAEFIVNCPLRVASVATSKNLFDVAILIPLRQVRLRPQALYVPANRTTTSILTIHRPNISICFMCTLLKLRFLLIK